MGFSPPLPAYRRVLMTVGCVFTVLPVPSVLWLCWIFVGPILMASEEFISFFIGISEMAACGVGVEMQAWLKRPDLCDRPMISTAFCRTEQ